MKCPHCHGPVDVSAKFCPDCGQALSRSLEPSAWDPALQRFLRGDYGGAEQLLKPLLARTGLEGARANAWAGHAAFFKGREQEAEALYRRALTLSPDLWDAHYQLGSLAFSRGRHAEAAEAFEQAARSSVNLEKHPLGPLFGGDVQRAQAQTQLYLGLCLREGSRIGEAEAALRRAIELNASDPLPYGVLGDLLVAAGRYDEAAGSYQEALKNVEDEQGLRSLRNDLGVAYFRAGRMEPAAEAFKAVLKEKPDDEHALHNLGMLYLKQGLGEELRQDLREFLKADSAEQLLLGLTRSMVQGARQRAVPSESETGIVGQSRVVRDVLDLVSRAADNDANVLLLGENGTGKELVARAIHRLGPRSAGPFVAVNCAALPETLLESELFGHEKGSFTGAIAAKLGRFELAAGGTLFLDEIGDLAPALQVKLLRAVQEKSFERVGGTQTLRSDFRLVTATHRDLRRMVVQGQFREDLFYRLFVIPIQLPPLRERSEDIPLLAEHFMKVANQRLGKDFERLDAQALQRLIAHPWPGNVRELENCMERAVAMHRGRVLLAEHISLAAAVIDAPAPDAALGSWTAIESAERATILQELKGAAFDMPVAAKRLGWSRATLYRKVGKYGLKSLNNETKSQI